MTKYVGLYFFTPIFYVLSKKKSKGGPVRGPTLGPRRSTPFIKSRYRPTEQKLQGTHDLPQPSQLQASSLLDNTPSLPRCPRTCPPDSKNCRRHPLMSRPTEPTASQHPSLMHLAHRTGPTASRRSFRCHRSDSEALRQLCVFVCVCVSKWTFRPANDEKGIVLQPRA